MAYIDVVLDANDEVTPTFQAEDIGGRHSLGERLHFTAQASRTTSASTSIDIALDCCMVKQDGTLFQMHNGSGFVDAWYQLDDNYLDLASSRDTYIRVRDYAYGTAYRLRYNTNSTTPIRVLVETPYRDAK